MAKLTDNMGLTKPELSDKISPEMFAENFELIDKHTHTPDKIETGILGAKVTANEESVRTLDAKQLRNISCGTNEMVVGESPLATGDIYVMYE